MADYNKDEFKEQEIDDLQNEYASLMIQLEQEKAKGLKKGIIIGSAITLFVAIVAYFIITGIGRANIYNSNSIVNSVTAVKADAIMQYIDRYYDGEYDKEMLQDYMLKGLVWGLGDPYSEYYNEEEATSTKEDDDGVFCGIGASFRMDYNTNTITVESIFKDCPAEKAGMKVGDVLVDVDSKGIENLSLEDVVRLIKGEKGTDVVLTVLRNGKTYDLIATRDEIVVNTVENKMIDKIGYVSVSQFCSVTPEQFSDAIDNLEEKGAKAIIIDLRDNPGGIVSACIEMLDRVLPEGVIFYTEDKNGEKEEYKTSDDTEVKLPIAVLVNENSASASEIFAGAMKDRANASIVGTTSYGKGVMQKMISLNDGSYLKLTIKEFFTPNGDKIHKVGIKPNYEVEDDNKEDDNDVQLNKALEVLSKEIK